MDTNKMNNEPVAWMAYDNSEASIKCTDEFCIPLYTHPADLTDEEIAQAWAEHTKIAGTYDVKDIIFPFAKAILRKAQEK